MELTEEYEGLQAVLDKRRECLETITAVSEMEDLFSTLSFGVDSTAVSLSSKSQQNLVKDRSGQVFSSQLVAENCMKNLEEAWSYLQSLSYCNQIHLQNASIYHQFWHEIEESSEWLQYQLSKVPEIFNTKSLQNGSSYEIKQTMDKILQTLKDFLQWQTRLDVLYDKSKLICPVHARREQLQHPRNVQVLIDYSTKDFALTKGEYVTLVENSSEKRWDVQIYTSDGDRVVSVPSILLVIPPTDARALDAANRLRSQMAAIWTAAASRLGNHVTKLLLLVFSDWNENEREIYGTMSDLQRKNLLSTINYMEQTLGFSLKGTSAYKTLIEKCTDVATYRSEPSNSQAYRVTLVVQVTLIQKLLQRYWDFWTYSESYKQYLISSQNPRKIFICNRDTRLKYITAAHYIRYLDVDLEESRSAAEGSQGHGYIEQHEEFVVCDTVDGLNAAPTEQAEEEEETEFFESGAKEQKTETEQMIESEMEVETTFVITGVIKNPGEAAEEIISLQDAIEGGIIDHANGLYKRSTGETMPIPQAMTEGFIKMGRKKEKKSEEKVKSAGIITVRTTRETRPYTVISAIEGKTGRSLTASEACEMGVLDPTHGTFKNTQTGAIMLVGDAVDARLVEVEYENNNNAMMLEEVTKTYLVHAVVCQRTRQRLPFHEAVQKGIIDKDSGAYFNNTTGEKLFVVDAINKGFIKATESDKPPSLHLGGLGNVAINDKVEKIKKKILNPLRALKLMKDVPNSNNANGTDNGVM